ncbi:MAG: tetratricopeptide repeat protein [Myxococcales bacterium]|nr:MAG: tetratricopeptide repeat protein [Myxococcales bacterium]
MKEQEKRFLCVHCDHSFFKTDDTQLRCPKCMRTHGIEPLSADKQTKKKAPWLWPSLGLVVVAIATAVFFFIAKPSDSSNWDKGSVPLEPLDTAKLHAFFVDKGVPDKAFVGAMASNAALKKASHDMLGKVSERKALVQSLLKQVGSLISEGRVRRFPWQGSRTLAISSAAATASLLNANEKELSLYPLELAVFVSALLREKGLSAMVVAFADDDQKRPPLDPSAKVGYYGVALHSDSKDSDSFSLYDLYLGERVTRDKQSFHVLNDVQVEAAMLSLKALLILQNEDDPKEALVLSEKALALYPRSASVRTVHGVIATAAGSLEGLKDIQAALELEPSAPRYDLLAAVLLAHGRFEEAMKQAALATEKGPKFAGGFATLAALYFQQGENEHGLAKLQEAEQIDPQYRALPMLWARYYMQQGNIDEAISKAYEAVQHDPGDWRMRLQYAQVLKAAGREDAALAQAQTILATANEKTKDLRRELIERIVGPITQGGANSDMDSDLTLGAKTGLQDQVDNTAGTSLLDDDLSLGSSSPSDEGPSFGKKSKSSPYGVSLR